MVREIIVATLIIVLGIMFSLFFLLIQVTSQNGQVSVNYYSIRIGRNNCFTVGWNYQDVEGQRCLLGTFRMEGFDLNQISENDLDAPRMVSGSVSGMFSLISSDVSTESLYFRVTAYDIHRQTCSSSSLSQFYCFSMLVGNGKHYCT